MGKKVCFLFFNFNGIGEYGCGYFLKCFLLENAST